ncbi:hypothetical protein PCANB_001088 [Pneumocystis canis]|nr:hypothetical protein PCANB_001088 [Pneumocystis canis]
MSKNLSSTCSEKAVLYERLLDAALCNHRWEAIPELTRKLKKHNVKKEALCEIVIVEARLAHFIQSQKNAKTDGKILRIPFLQASDLLPIVDDTFMRGILDTLLKFLDSLDTQHEKLHAQTVLSYVYFLMANYKSALETISPYCKALSIMESSGYCLFNVIRGYAIKGLSHECLFELSLASETYQSAVSIVAQIKQEKFSEPTYEWLDIIYYRCSLLLLNSNSYTAIKLDFLDNMVSRIKEALYSTAVYRLYFRLLSELLNKSILHDKIQAKSSELKSDDSLRCIFSTYDLKSRIFKVQSVYENLLMQVVSFPKAGQLNGIILEYVDWVMQNWKNIGKELEYTETIVETIYRAISKTYKSHRLVRYLMEVLIFLGNYREAQRSFDLYVELVERARISPFRQRILARRKQSIEQDADQDFDDDSTIVETYFEKAMVIVKKLLDALDTWDFLRNDKIMSDVWEAIGMAYSCQSIKTHEASERPSMQQNAVSAFQKSLKYISNKESALYHLAFQYAEQREIMDAILIIKHVVSQKYKLYQSLHLLSLLLSARGEYDQAIQVCEAAIQISGVETSENCSYLDYRDRECLIEIKFTLCALLEVKYVFGVDEFSSPVFNISEIKIPLETISSIVFGENKETLLKPFEEQKLSHVFLKKKKYSTNNYMDGLHVSKTKNRYLHPSRSDSNILRFKSLSSNNISQQKISSFKPSESQYDYLKKEQKEISKRCLRKLWLISASLYCRASQWENSQLSIKEAEKNGMFHPDVHTQWGILYYYLNKLDDAAKCFEWALLEDHDHINANIGLSKVFLEFQGEMHDCYRDRAEQMLDMVTKLSGWDLSEAWLLLGEAWEKMNDLKNAKKAYLYAVELENTRPVRHWRNVSPRFVA